MAIFYAEWQGKLSMPNGRASANAARTWRVSICAAMAHSAQAVIAGRCSCSQRLAQATAEIVN
jgi:hypothetical protein